MKIWKLSTSLESEQIAAANKEDDETLFRNLLQQGEYLHSKTNLPVETYEKGELNNLLTYKGFCNSSNYRWICCSELRKTNF
ncbi:hypothetical protein BMWSH_2398 [Priestia megaterium WSH-002]|uniref:Uncharacterized protein n=1 Tax=Priestia megaterium (strain WSH-002) TaxID=1006007 RepID=A0A8D3X1Q8_PRIMW|nr:hypothetical protein [Priestia megaterium]AEN89280.1 hypothetical protein BMWSH_2398 [Priestia megaterium WSH-002]